MRHGNALKMDMGHGNEVKDRSAIVQPLIVHLSTSNLYCSENGHGTWDMGMRSRTTYAIIVQPLIVNCE